MFRRYDCTYCGEPAPERDHVTPKAVSGKKSFSNAYVVPSCSECNRILSVKGDVDGYYSISSKADYLIEKYNEKYHDFITGIKGSHDDDDIAEMTGKMKRIVKADKKKRDRILHRLEWLQMVSVMDPSIDDVWDEIKQNEPEEETNE